MKATEAGQAVTAVVLTLNEAAHLPECLASLRWADRLLVVDSGSRDATVSAARHAGAEVASRAFENYSRQRNAALAMVGTPWTLFVDADERVPAALALSIRRELAAPVADGYWIPRENWFWGHRIRGGGWWPDRQLRLLRTASTHYDPQRAVHEVPILDGPDGVLDAPLVHLNYDSWAEFRRKQRAYARMEADRRRSAGLRPRWRNVATMPFREFWRRFVSLEGWRDGVLGLLLALHMAGYEIVTLQEMWRPFDPES